jgi:hypothetical protein
VTHDPRYSSARWKKLRKLIRERDGDICQLRLRGCKVRAQCVDHTIEPGPPGTAQSDALFWNANNCVAACVSCNTSKRNSHRNALARLAEQQQPGAFGTSRQW